MGYPVTDIYGFGTIRNNTALKLHGSNCRIKSCFGTIRNNTALKQPIPKVTTYASFGTIRNNTALKLVE